MADRLEPRLQKRFLAAVAKLQGQIDLDTLIAEIEARNLPAIIAATGIEQLADEFSLHTNLLMAASAAGTIASEYLKAAGIPYPWESVNADAVAWARAYSGQRITAISAESLDAVRAIVESAFTRPDFWTPPAGVTIPEGWTMTGMSPRQAAQQIRAVVGLNQPQAQAVLHARLDMWADGVDPAVIDRDTAAFARGFLNLRAETIARTEIMAASNKGQRLLWDGAQRAGLLDASRTEREWVWGGGENSCQVCEYMNGKRAPLDGEYRGDYPDGPPGHPRCRCTEGLVFKGE